MRGVKKSIKQTDANVILRGESGHVRLKSEIYFVHSAAVFIGVIYIDKVNLWRMLSH